MGPVVLAAPERRWACPNCDATDITREAGQHTRFHTCGGLAGLTAPMVPHDQRVKVEAIEREDYIGSEDVRLDDDGRPIMSVLTTRDEGTDLVVYAPTAYARET